jgi:voltage-gated potassium channel
VIKEKAVEKEGWRSRWYTIIFESDTKAGRRFDIILLFAIIGSLLVIMLETVPGINEKYPNVFISLEWFFTILFSLEYLVRLRIVSRPWTYALSFYGIIDLISILPSYLAIVLGGAQYFIVIRSLRLLRVFRVLKMVRFIGEANVLSGALRASRHKIAVFIIAVVCMTFIMGTVMYMVEGPEHGFKSIPVAIYWCIVTLTTVGYGDISPQTPLGQLIASIIMILGYGIIAVPTGIVTSELNKQNQATSSPKTKVCAVCNTTGLPIDAHYCFNCGEKIS